MNERKTLGQLFVPICIETIFFMLAGMVDTLMLSSVGDQAVGAVGTANTYISMFIIMYSVVSNGMMAVMTLYTFGRVVNTVTINGIFTAGGDTMFDFYSLAVTMWGIALPLAALGTFVFHWPVWVIYGCTCLDEVGKIPWVLFHFRKYKWVKDLTREQLTA